MRDDLNSALGEYYSKFYMSSELEFSFIIIMRNHLMDMLSELVIREGCSGDLRCHITAAGEKYIRNFLGEEKI